MAFVAIEVGDAEKVRTRFACRREADVVDAERHDFRPDTDSLGDERRHGVRRHQHVFCRPRCPADRPASKLVCGASLLEHDGVQHVRHHSGASGSREHPGDREDARCTMAANERRQRKAFPQETSNELVAGGASQRHQAQAGAGSDVFRDQRAFAGNDHDRSQFGIVGQVVSELRRPVRRAAVAGGQRVDDDRTGRDRRASRQRSRPDRANVRSTNQARACSNASMSLCSVFVLAIWRLAKRAADSWNAWIVRALTPLAPVA
jgi:hypothetical protein